jgi:hypothetical protein
MSINHWGSAPPPRAGARRSLPALRFALTGAQRPLCQQSCQRLPPHRFALSMGPHGIALRLQSCQRVPPRRSRCELSMSLCSMEDVRSLCSLGRNCILRLTSKGVQRLNVLRPTLKQHGASPSRLRMSRCPSSIGRAPFDSLRGNG